MIQSRLHSPIVSRAVLRNERWRRGQLTFWLSVGALSAAISFALHHLPYFAEHEIVGSIGAVALASAAAVLAVGTAASRRHAAPPAVVIASSKDTRVGRLQARDVHFCASLHAEMLAQGLFVSLGPLFMRAYYETFLSSPYALSYIASVKDHGVGMLVGLTDPKAHIRWALRHRGIVLATLGVGALLTRPLVTFRFLRTRTKSYARTWRRHRARQDIASRSFPKTAVLSHTAVLPGAQGTGVGTRLVNAFLEDASTHGCEEAVLITSLDEDVSAKNFYAALGWSAKETRKGADGQSTLVMTKRLAEQPDPPN